MEGFQKLIQITTVNFPERIVYIGDDLRKDVKPALECGLQAILVTHNEGESVELADGFLKINNLYQLKEVLG